MPLIDDTGFVADSWVRVGDEVALPNADLIIVLLARLEQVFPSPPSTSDISDIDIFNSKIEYTRSLLGEGDPKDRVRGVHISNTTRIEEVKPYLKKLTLISIDFPSFSDGRGFSLALSLRNTGFTGELRAYGPLIADQYAYALSCGFDTIEIPDDIAARQPEAQWKATFASMSSSYQRSFVHGKNILDQRSASNQPFLLPLREKVSRSDG